MSTDPVAYIAPLREIQAAAGPAAPEFGPWLAQALGQVNQGLAQADRGLQGLAAGETESLHQVMISLEEARLGLQLLVQVRNRLLEAYQEVLRMQL
jgi:flagellar hook-basal body complex protein FliE